jgi:dienelactone hydrolase
MVVIVLAWAAIGSGRRLPRVVVELLVSFVAVPVGVGIGVPYLAKTGLSILGIAGLCALVGGLVLFADAVATLFRSARRVVAFPALAVLVVVLLVMVWSLGQAVAATNPPRPHLGSRTPASLGLPYRDVEFRAADGVRLSGWYIPSRNRAAVVLLHGSGSTRSNVLDHAGVLARHGFGVLLYDARGHGRSAGRAMDFGWYGDDDVAGAITFLRHQPDVDHHRLAAIGMSMGGEEAIGAAARIRDIRAVVAEGATNRVAGDKAWMSSTYGARGALTEGLETLTYAFADLLTTAQPPITLRDAVRAAAPRPILLIAAGDVPDESHAARYVQRGSPHTVDVWVAPHTNHTHALASHPKAWETKVTTFLDQALGVGAATPRGGD